jgi:phosphomannomutase
MDETAIERVLYDLQSNLAREASLSTMDGVRLEFEDGWGMARQSVTEPVITLRFEGKTTQALNKIMQRFENAAPNLKGRLII